jgi:hypothetical protein
MVMKYHRPDGNWEFYLESKLLGVMVGGTEEQAERERFRLSQIWK